jgi:hypothetical protein
MFIQTPPQEAFPARPTLHLKAIHCFTFLWVIFAYQADKDQCGSGSTILT